MSDTDDFDDDDLDNTYADSERYSYDDSAALRGTSECDGLCDPQCDWCLVAHDCPDAHGDEPCPYEALIAEGHARSQEFLVVRPDGSGVRVTLALETDDDIDF